ncbi:hypothetical protein BC832DRAFT_615078 [Gaertneriomyces semiglobifer]|nr:hypothetical protein BC832DRAFT_615078 [Gaertneriomyces semiglobifer]
MSGRMAKTAILPRRVRTLSARLCDAWESTPAATGTVSLPNPSRVEEATRCKRKGSSYIVTTDSPLEKRPKEMPPGYVLRPYAMRFYPSREQRRIPDLQLSPSPTQNFSKRAGQRWNIYTPSLPDGGRLHFHKRDMRRIIEKHPNGPLRAVKITMTKTGRFFMHAPFYIEKILNSLLDKNGASTDAPYLPPSVRNRLSLRRCGIMNLPGLKMSQDPQISDTVGLGDDPWCGRSPTRQSIGKWISAWLLTCLDRKSTLENRILV